MTDVIASGVLANGLRTDFWDTYYAIRNRQKDSRLAMVMDLGIPATNRQHEFGYFNAADHAEHWLRGTSIPTGGFDSASFTVPVFSFGKRVKWHRDDRDDDQTQSLTDNARRTGESLGLLPERFFFDLITGATATLPALPLAPDGAALFATTAGGANRFGVSSGNLLTGTGVASLSAIKTDYYTAIEQFMLFQDGKGQPLFSKETIDGGVVIIHGAANTEVFEEAFLQRRQGIVKGTDAGTTPSNLVIDASRDVTLWGTSRITDNDWFVFLKNPPKKPTFYLDRKGVVEESAITGENNSDLVRTTGEEYMQWHNRAGGGIALPYGAIKVNN